MTPLPQDTGDEEMWGVFQDRLLKIELSRSSSGEVNLVDMTSDGNANHTPLCDYRTAHRQAKAELNIYAGLSVFFFQCCCVQSWPRMRLEMLLELGRRLQTLWLDVLL